MEITSIQQLWDTVYNLDRMRVRVTAELPNGSTEISTYTYYYTVYDSKAQLINTELKPSNIDLRA